MRGFLKYSIPIMGFLSLTGCASLYSETFECGSKEGVGCKSIAEVDEMINLKDPHVFANYTSSKIQTPYPKKREEILPFTSASSQNPPFISNPSGSVTRMREHWQRVWFAPHQDHEGIFYEGITAYIIVRPGQWQMS